MERRATPRGGSGAFALWTREEAERDTHRSVGRRAMSKKNPTVGEQIIGGLKEAIAYNRGELTGARETRVPITAAAAKVKPAPRYSGARIARLRARLALSQTVFAKALNVSAETVRSWEQEKRVPTAPRCVCCRLPSGTRTSSSRTSSDAPRSHKVPITERWVSRCSRGPPSNANPRGCELRASGFACPRRRGRLRATGHAGA